MTRISRSTPQLALGVRLQALRHGGDAVGLLDAERDGFRVRRIAAEQRDVGAMQRRDDFRRRPASGGAARIWRARYAAVACGIA